MDKLAKAFQRLVECRPDLFGYNLYGEALLRGERYGPLKAKKLRYPHLFTQDRCDEVAAEIGYVLIRDACPVHLEDDEPKPLYDVWFEWMKGDKKSERYAYDAKSITTAEVPKANTTGTQATLTTAINHFCDNLPVQKSNFDTGEE